MALVGIARENVENLLDSVREAIVFIVKKGVPSEKFRFSPLSISWRVISCKCIHWRSVGLGSGWFQRVR